MLFNSWEFAIFFVVVLALYASTRVRIQNAILLLASYFFYGWWDWRFMSLVAISTLVDYLVARKIAALPAERARTRKVWLLASMTANLGMLGFFKYFNFFIDSAVVALESLGFAPNAPTLEIILPVGISFYTFQTMAYTIDVYRGHMKPVKSLFVFALYVCYFPQLVAGPIERPETLVPQLENPRRLDWDRVSSGAFLVLIGFVRKVGIADVVAPEVDAVFQDPGSQTSIGLIIGVLLFAVQIYGDFSGYSAIARGTSRVMGIELMENFRQPYFATNITDFWRRWHISLSTWLRDYLYISLGGNRASKLATYRNLMVTMLLGGLWHGASWNFVIWGGIHGAALAVHKFFLGERKASDSIASRSFVGMLSSAAGWAVTMLIVLFAWIFFRARSFGDARAVISGIGAWRGEWEWSEWLLPITMILWLALIDWPMYRNRNQTAMMRWPWPIRGILYAGFILAMVLLERAPDASFIYFQF